MMHSKRKTNQGYSITGNQWKQAVKRAESVLTGLDKKQGKMVVHIFINFNNCWILNQITYKVKQSQLLNQVSIPIGEISALVNLGANVIAPVLLSLAFLCTVMPKDWIEQFLNTAWQAVSRANGKEILP